MTTLKDAVALAWSQRIPPWRPLDMNDVHAAFKAGAEWAEASDTRAFCPKPTRYSEVPACRTALLELLKDMRGVRDRFAIGSDIRSIFNGFCDRLDCIDSRVDDSANLAPSSEVARLQAECDRLRAEHSRMMDALLTVLTRK